MSYTIQIIIRSCSEKYQFEFKQHYRQYTEIEV